MHTHGGTYGTHMPTQYMPTSILFEQEVLHVLAALNVIKITCIPCAHITTHDFHSSSNLTVL